MRSPTIQNYTHMEDTIIYTVLRIHERYGKKKEKKKLFQINYRFYGASPKKKNVYTQL